MVRSARLWGILAAALAAGAAAPATAEPPRVMSIEACANQYVLALADREQIISLAKGADDPRTSFLHEKARGIPANQRSAEEVIAADPDLVFTGPFSRRTREFLQRFHIRIVRTKRPKTLAELSAQIRRVAGILGHPERGERLASSIDGLAAGAVRRTRRAAADGRHLPRPRLLLRRRYPRPCHHVGSRDRQHRGQTGLQAGRLRPLGDPARRQA